MPPFTVPPPVTTTHNAFFAATMIPVVYLKQRDDDAAAFRQTPREREYVSSSSPSFLFARHRHEEPSAMEGEVVAVKSEVVQKGRRPATPPQHAVITCYTNQREAHQEEHLHDEE